ncbi:MAG: caspase family protein [Alphaproteobacteria bacterium]
MKEHRAAWRGGVATAVLAALVSAVSVPGEPAAAAERALVIGIDSYADARLSQSSRAAAADIAAITAALIGPLRYAPATIMTLVDAAATNAAIRAAFDDWLIAGSAPGDRVFLYFAGLGYFTDDLSGDEADGVDETLLPFDTAIGGGAPVTLANTVSDDDLSALVAALAGRLVTIVVDAGHAGIVAATAGGGVDAGTMRAVALPGSRAIVVEPRVQAQKAAGPPLDTAGFGDNVAVFAATSGGQMPLTGPKGGVFTQAFTGAVGGAKADKNGNGYTSNAEILAYVRYETETACRVAGCALGQTPTLGPASAAAGSPLGPATKTGLTTSAVLDYFAAGDDGRVSLQQNPGSPVHVGAENIRFRVISQFAGSLILLDLSDDGRLVQLFPNQYVRQAGRAGAILADSPITVPDDYYGTRFNATAPARGTLIALVTHEPITLPAAVKTRAIEVIARPQSADGYLAAIAGALAAPVDGASTGPTRALDWSVVTLRYEIIP